MNNVKINNKPKVVKIGSLPVGTICKHTVLDKAYIIVDKSKCSGVAVRLSDGVLITNEDMLVSVIIRIVAGLIRANRSFFYGG